ncbi:MAG: asparaginase [Acidobacteria bacterium]|nr:asparaginase [Acidobacteriota bacterium]
MTAHAQAAKPKIAVFSGPTATIQHGPPLVTSNNARAKYGLALLANPDGTPLRFDILNPQRLAAPVTVYIKAFSAHPLEQDMSELYAPPDGYVNPQTGAFSKEKRTTNDVPAHEVTLRPEDGLYMLPYMARQSDGSAWDGDCAFPLAPAEKCRVTFYPDASRIFEEIDRFGGNLLGSKANFDFYRAAPSGGYRKGLAAHLRTDVGEGDIPKEVLGEDFYTYGSSNPKVFRQDPAMPTLARLTNVVQRALLRGEYTGAIWLEGSPTTEETTYWLNLLIDTTVPIVGNSSQRVHGEVGNDGDRNIVSSVEYILSGIWKDESGRDKIGAVSVQEDQAFTAREIQKGDDRPGGYVVTGGHGGIVASTNPIALTFVPTKKHTYSSEVNLSRLPVAVQGVRRVGNRVETVSVAIKDQNGNLLASAIPKVTFAKYSRYAADSYSDDPMNEIEILGRIEKNLKDHPLSGFVLEGMSPYGYGDEPTMNALEKAILSGIPVVQVGRGNSEGFVATPIRERGSLFITGSNLTATKARLLLMACLMKFGALPLPSNPEHPTTSELNAIRAKIAEYQEVFDTH